jgi:uroporphyrinogen decarboxylase
MAVTTLAGSVKPDCEALIANILRKGTPKRVHHIELFLDGEVQDAVCQRFGIAKGLDKNDPVGALKRQIAIQRFLGYDFVRCSVEGVDMQFKQAVAEDTADLKRGGGRSYTDEHTGPIMTWEEFEKYPWPDPQKITTRVLEWYEKNLPDGMCVIGSGGFAHFCEWISWLMGYETLCFALFDNRALIKAIVDRSIELNVKTLKLLLQFKRVKIIWGSDDMGFRSGTLISPKDLREFVLPGHKLMAQMSHDAGRPYLLHSCGNLATIMDDLVADVKIDAKHSFEDTIERVEDAKRTYGQKVALLGGVDVDFLCNASEEQIRARVRATLDACMPGGGYCLGTGNSVANYIPLDSYLAMVDEGRRY